GARGAQRARVGLADGPTKAVAAPAAGRRPAAGTAEPGQVVATAPLRHDGAGPAQERRRDTDDHAHVCVHLRLRARRGYGSTTRSTAARRSATARRRGA